MKRINFVKAIGLRKRFVGRPKFATVTLKRSRGGAEILKFKLSTCNGFLYWRAPIGLELYFADGDEPVLSCSSRAIKATCGWTDDGFAALFDPARM